MDFDNIIYNAIKFSFVTAKRLIKVNTLMATLAPTFGASNNSCWIRF